jgi:hypothetical protein
MSWAKKYIANLKATLPPSAPEKAWLIADVMLATTTLRMKSTQLRSLQSRN